MNTGIAAAAGIVFATVTAAVILFQVALALGAPWGRYAMGGSVQDRCPAPMRVVALVQAMVLAGLAVIVISDAGLCTRAVRPDLRG